jgi:hypothetical protein
MDPIRTLSRIICIVGGTALMFLAGCAVSALWMGGRGSGSSPAGEIATEVVTLGFIFCYSHLLRVRAKYAVWDFVAGLIAAEGFAFFVITGVTGYSPLELVQDNTHYQGLFVGASLPVLSGLFLGGILPAILPAKRPWFQFHLITWIVVVLTIGLLLGLNLRLHGSYYGWPFAALHVMAPGYDNEVEWPGMLFNAATGITISVIAGMAAEWFFRRRGRQP